MASSPVAPLEASEPTASASARTSSSNDSMAATHSRTVSIGETVEEQLLDLVNALSVSFSGSAATAENDNDTAWSYSFTVPSLSLEHGQDASLPAGSTKKQAEEHAAALLSRTMPALLLSSSDCASAAAGLSQLLLSNLFASLEVLIHCRLRNYAIFLARHGVALSRIRNSNADGVVTIEQKLTTLLETGRHIVPHISTLELSAVEREQDDDEQQIASNNSSTVRLALQLEAAMELHAPCPATDTTLRIQVSSLCAPAVLTGFLDDETKALSAVELTIDTQALLNTMIKQASHVVAAVVDVANTTCIFDSSKLPRSASFLAMPPPPASSDQQQALMMPHQQHQQDDEDEAPELLDHAEQTNNKRGFHIVSPLHAALHRHSSKNIPSLDLVVTDDEDDSLAALSADQCADIVDEIFGDLDDSILCCHAPISNKKRKTESTSLPL